MLKKIFVLLCVSFVFSTSIAATKKQIHSASFSRGCINTVVSEINSAVYTISIKTYRLNSLVLVDALRMASERGVKLRLVADRTAMDNLGDALWELPAHQIPIFIAINTLDKNETILIIDALKVIYLPLNQDKKDCLINNKHRLIIKENEKLAADYLKSWQPLFAQAKVIKEPPQHGLWESLKFKLETIKQFLLGLYDKVAAWFKWLFKNKF